MINTQALKNLTKEYDKYIKIPEQPKEVTDRLIEIDCRASVILEER